MSTTRCADALGVGTELVDRPTRDGVAVFDRIADLPPAARALFDPAPDGDLFSGVDWFDTVLDCGMAADAVPRFVVCGDALQPIVMLPMQTLAGGRRLASLTTLYTCRYQPLCAPGATPAALLAAFTAFAWYCRAWPTVRLDALDADAPWLPGLREAATAVGLTLRQFAHFGNWYEVVAGVDWAGYLATRPGSLRETVRRRLARADREGCRFALITGGAPLQSGIAAYETVYARSWKTAEPYPRFNAALMRAAAARGLLRLGVLWQGDRPGDQPGDRLADWPGDHPGDRSENRSENRPGDRPVAAQFWIVADGQATVLKLAHDQAAKELSPGTVLTARMLHHLLDQEQVRQIDFGRGDDPYKRLWASQRRQRIGVVLANPRHPLGLAFLARHALGRVRRALRAQPASVG